jgi:hypothetical protein
MVWQSTPYFPPLAVSALILAVLGAYAWRHRQVRGAPGFIILMAGGAVWAVSYGLYLAAADRGWAAVWIGCIYLGIVAQPIGWLLLAVEYAGRGRGLTRSGVALLVLGHLAFVALVFTNDWHHWVFRSFTAVREGGSVEFAAVPAVGFWVNVWVSYALIVFSMLLLLIRATSAPPLYRWQVAVLVAGWVVTAIPNLLYLAGDSPLPGINLTPFVVPVKGALLTLGIFPAQTFHQAKHHGHVGLRDADTLGRSAGPAGARASAPAVVAGRAHACLISGTEIKATTHSGSTGEIGRSTRHEAKALGP